MLAIRLQRTGRSGHSQFRVIVQDSRFSPTRGRVVAYLGSYDPHTKVAAIDGEKASAYLENGAQPSDRVARLLQKEGIKLPEWVKLDQPQKRAVRNPAKRRSTRPEEPKAPETEVPAEEAPAAETSVEGTPADPETPTDEVVETPAEESPSPEVEESPADTPDEETAPEPAPETAAEPDAAPEDTPAS
jgi:small subunit ribosomal protein S16